MNVNLHPPRWLVYVAIVVFCLLISVFIYISFSDILMGTIRHNRHQVEDIKADAKHRADSLSVVISTQVLMQQLTADSLQKRVESVARKADIDKKIIIRKYENAYRQVLILSDDSLALIDSLNGPKYEQLLNRYGLGN